MSERVARDYAYDVINGCKETILDKQSPCPSCIALAIMQAEERGRRAGIEEAALAPDEAVKRLTAAMREADRLFEHVGGSARHHVRDCLLPLLEKHGLLLIDALSGDRK